MTADTKPDIDPVRWHPPGQRALPAPDLTRRLRMIQVPGPAPEDVVVDGDGNVLTGLADGKIARIGATTGTSEVIGDTGGRPLGLAVARDGRILVCDSHRGLLRLDPASGEIETLVADVDGRPLTFCSNVVEAADGTVYFTESSSRFHYEFYKAAILEGRGTGGLYRRDNDGTVTTLLSGLEFANGVTLTADESALVFAETSGARVSKYWLTGPKAGTVTPLAQDLPGYPDNVSTAPDGRIWVAMVSDRNRLTEFLAPRAPGIRKLMWRLPYTALPDVKPLVWLLALDPDDGRVVTQLRQKHPTFGSSTGVVQHGDRVWIAGIGRPIVAYFDI